MMMIETTFKSTYRLKAGGDMESGGNVYYFPGSSREEGKDGVIVKVFNTQGESWIGVFAFGLISPKGVTGIYQLPDEERFCVVSKGTAYVVSAGNPKDWEEVPLLPILDVRCSERHKLLILSNYTELCAYGCRGMQWTTKRLSWHDLRIKNVSEIEVVAEYWDILDETVREVRVDLRDGSSIGAAEID